MERTAADAKESEDAVVFFVSFAAYRLLPMAWPWRSLAAYCCALGDMRSIAPYCGCLARAKHRGLMPVLAGRSHAAYCFASGGRSLAPFLHGSLVEL